MTRLRYIVFVFTTLFILVPTYSLSSIISATPIDVSDMVESFELDSTYNVVAYVKLATDAAGDTLTSIKADNYADNPADSSDVATAHLWYMPDDFLGRLNTVTAFYLGPMTYNPDRAISTWELAGLTQPVGNNSGLYITVDISPMATPGNEFGLEFLNSFITFQSGYSSPMGPNLSAPFVSISSFFPASPLSLNYSKSGQAILSTNQAFTSLSLTIDNIGSTAVATAPIYLQGLTVTVKDQSNTVVAPDLVLQKIGVFGVGAAGPVYGEVSAVPSAAVPVYIPFATTVTVSNALNLDLFATTTSNTSTALAAFSLEINHGSSVAAQDAISLRPVSVQAGTPDTFPFQSNLFTLRFAVTRVNVYHTPILTSSDSLFKGQTDVRPLGLTFINPGVTNTAQAEITGITLSLTDSSDNPVIPGTTFSRMAIVGTDITYGELTSLPSSGNQMTISLTSSSISVPVYQPITATVAVDILPSATATDFKLTVTHAAAITAQDGNSQLTILVLAAFGSNPFPMSSEVINIATSFNLTGQSIAPATVYPNARSKILELTVNHPGPATVGELLLHGMTITAKDNNGQLIDVSQDLKSVYISDTANQILGIVTPTGSSFYIDFSLPLMINPFSTATLYLEQVAADDFQHQLFTLSLDANTDVQVSQPSDPTRSVFVAGLWPLASSAMTLGGGEGRLFLTNYPNPFAAGYTTTAIAFYLEQSCTVSIKAYTLLGDQVAVLLNNEFRAGGAHQVSWDGRSETGSVVKNGVYLIKVEALPVAAGDKLIQIRKVAVVK